MRSRVLVIAAVALVASACHPLESFEPVVSGADDRFELQATHVKSITGSAVYDWTNAGTRALVIHSTTTTSHGFASITIRDAAGELVYSATLRPDFAQETMVGVPGPWSIVVTMTGYSGNLHVRIETL